MPDKGNSYGTCHRGDGSDRGPDCRAQANLTELRRAQPPEAVADVELEGVQGSVKLSELFAGKNDLLVIHNMGKGCAYCTLRADGFTGFYPEINSRTGFALASPNPITIASAFAAERGWNYPVVSDTNSEFAKSVGFYVDGEGAMHGVSAFHKGDVRPLK